MKVAAFVDDLFFSSKISATARETGAEIVFCRSAAVAPRDADRICIDLNAGSFDAIAEIRALKASHPAPVIAYLSHVQTALQRQAQEAGADEVLPRSLFVQRLPELLGGPR